MAELAHTDRLPHSLLLVGPEGSGKEALALELARLALRTGENDDACDRKVRALQHPDLYYVCPVERGLTRDGYREILDAKAAEPLSRVRQPSSVGIPIGDRDDPGLVSVRAIRRFVQMPPFEGRRKAVIVSDAHRMNRQAANALLKTLEEPPSSTLLLLCTHQPHLLPATIPSRCARVTVPAFSESELAALLVDRAEVDEVDARRIAAVAGGNARRALDLLDPVSREIADWAEEVVAMLLRGDRGGLSVAAERISKGRAPSGSATAKKKPRGGGDASLAASRDVGMRLIDFVTADLRWVMRRSQGLEVESSVGARLPAAEALSGEAVARAIDRLTRARADLARNLNVGLVLMDSLLEAGAMLQAPAMGEA